MSVDVDFLPHLITKDTMLIKEYNRRNSWATSISSSSCSPSNGTSWLERKLFSHFKRFFRRKSISLTSNSSLSSRRPSSTNDDIISLPVDEQPQQEEVEEQEQVEEIKAVINIETPSMPLTAVVSQPIDLLYDYNRLLKRCTEQQECDRTEMLLHCQNPISIPHANLIVGQKRTIVINWKSYIRLFNGLKRDAYLFQKYVNQYYVCRSYLNQCEQLILNVRTTKKKFDNVLQKFLGDYVTCLKCQTAQTQLIKSDGSWRIECQLCSSQRNVERLRRTHHIMKINDTNNNNHK